VAGGLGGRLKEKGSLAIGRGFPKKKTSAVLAEGSKKKAITEKKRGMGVWGWRYNKISGQ